MWRMSSLLEVIRAFCHTIYRQLKRDLFSDGLDFAAETELSFQISPPKDSQNEIEISVERGNAFHCGS
jgi:hypothetical protein